MKFPPMNLFETLKPAPADPILGLSESFRSDPNPQKVNLSVGVYQDANGKCPTLQSVQIAMRAITSNNASKSYLPIAGDPAFLHHAQNLVFGVNNEMVATGRIASIQTPGGTGGLRIAADFLRHCLNRRQIWMSRPTWANHQGIFSAADLQCEFYPYYNAGSHTLNREGMIAVLEDLPPNDPVLFHACCHNPTGIDPTYEDWQTIAKVCKAQKLLPVLDFAYQGFAGGLVEDAVAVRAFAEYGLEFLVCSSFSKNFGLYQDRIGALHVVAKNADEASRILSNLKVIVRTNYSNPPALGSAIVKTILADKDLTQLWEEELYEMCTRIRSMRTAFVEGLAAAGVPGDFDFIRQQFGMFSFSGLSTEAVQKLRSDFAIYIVDSGRINVAGLNPSNIDYTCQAINAVLAANP